MARRRPPADEACPCGRGARYGDCCRPYLDGQRAAPDAESLMRSRYTAYVRGASQYLLATWHPATRPMALTLADPQPPRWLGLELRRATVIDQDHASVEFVARYKQGGRARRLHETSRFVRVDGRWFYLDGDTGD